MREIKQGYMTVTMDIQPEGINLSCWMSTVEFWMSEQVHYTYQYTHMGEHCTWLIHSNMELTAKWVAIVAQTADDICRRQMQINERRKIANR